MEKETKPPLLPDKAPHFFVRVAFDFLPEIPYKDLIHLSQLAEEADTKKNYEKLVDSLIKLQWAKFAGMEAIVVENRISKQTTEDTIPFDPIGQAQHSKALFDFVSHTKASLDSLAVFLNVLFNLGKKGGERDFRKIAFCRQVCKIDTVIGEQLESLEIWLDKDRNNSDSVVAIRDQWLHRESPSVTAMFPLVEVGYLPIPRTLKEGFPCEDTPISSQYYWTTSEFVEFHFKKLTELFGVILTRCIALEQSKISTSTPHDLSASHPISFFPMKATRGTTPRQIKMRKSNPVFLNANTLLEELPHKLLSVLTKNEADLFAKLAENITFIVGDQDHYFVLFSDRLLKDDMGMRQEDIVLLEQVGLITNCQLKIVKGSTLICGNRGWTVSWSDDQERSIIASSFTRFGKELASLIKVKGDNSYVNNVTSLLNTSKVDVQLLAISDFKNGSFNYDNLGFYSYKEFREQGT